MRRKNLTVLLFAALICLLMMPGCSAGKGSDKVRLIEQELSKIYQQDKKINVFSTSELSNGEIVAFSLSDAQSKCGLAVLKPLENSQYELKSVAQFEQLTKRATDIYVKYIDAYDEGTVPTSYLVILSLNPELSEIKWTTLEGEPERYVVDANPSMTVIALKQEPFTGEYLFYDKSGGLIE